LDCAGMGSFEHFLARAQAIQIAALGH